LREKGERERERDKTRLFHGEKYVLQAREERNTRGQRERDVRTSGNGRTEEAWILKIEGIA